MDIRSMFGEGDYETNCPGCGITLASSREREEHDVQKCMEQHMNDPNVHKRVAEARELETELAPMLLA